MTVTERPVGPVVDPTPAKSPGPVTITGRYGTLTRLDAANDCESLWQAIRGHDSIWDYMSYGPFADFKAFSHWLGERERLNDPYYYSVLDPDSRALGLVSLVSIQAAMRSVEAAHILYSPALQRTRLATEAQYLLARYAFETLGYRRYEWKCNALNRPSYRAALRYGFTFEGIFRQHMIVKGRSRDTAWFSMLDGEWPVRKAGFERWLAPENFDAAGRQKMRLEQCMS
jgi:RimJ/RimL family protein N-acetyltransferase